MDRDQLQQIFLMMRDGQDRNEQRRARVLAHPHIAKRLTERPLSYPTPEHWHGYIPPALWREELNDAPERQALLDITWAVEEAEEKANPSTLDIPEEGG